MNRFSALLTVLLLHAAPAAHATTFTSQPAFLASLQPGYYLEDFNGLPDNAFLGSPLSFSGNGFGYDASNPDGLYSTPSNGGDIALATLNSGQSITITFTAGTVTAVGGTLFGSDINGSFTPGAMVAQLDTGELITIAVPDPTSFAGFTSASPILSFTIYPENFDSSYWPTLDNLIVGQAITLIPEPSTFVLITAAAGLSGLVSLGRKRVVALR